MQGTIGLSWGKVRRYYLTHFRPHYAQKQTEKRLGVCRRCGACCRIVLQCPFLKDDNHCTIYGHRPLQCRGFPINEKDLLSVPNCGFRFGNLFADQKGGQQSAAGTSSGG